MPRSKLSIGERIAQEEAKRTAAERELKRLKAAKKEQEDNRRAHVGIVVGLPLIEHAFRNPASEVRAVIVRVLEHHMTLRPNDPPVAELLARLKAPASVSPAGDAEKLTGDDPSQDGAELISDAAE